MSETKDNILILIQKAATYEHLARDKKQSADHSEAKQLQKRAEELRDQAAELCDVELSTSS